MHGVDDVGAVDALSRLASVEAIERLTISRLPGELAVSKSGAYRTSAPSSSFSSGNLPPKPHGIHARPETTGRTMGGIPRQRAAVVSPMEKPWRRKLSTVRRLHWQPSAKHAHAPPSRSCQLARRPSSARRCSRKSSVLPGRSTRLISSSAWSTSTTVQRTSVETTVSKVASGNGRACAGARTTSASRANRRTRRWRR